MLSLILTRQLAQLAHILSNNSPTRIFSTENSASPLFNYVYQHGLLKAFVIIANIQCSNCVILDRADTSAVSCSLSHHNRSYRCVEFYSNYLPNEPAHNHYLIIAKCKTRASYSAVSQMQQSYYHGGQNSVYQYLIGLVTFVHFKTSISLFQALH